MFARSAFRAARSPIYQSARFNSTKSSGGSGNTALFAGVALAAGAGAYYYVQTQGAPAKILKGPPTGESFTGGKQGWIPLTLKQVEDVNHNTKKFVFALPVDTEVSGLKVASILLTKMQKEGEKPVIRPYTPISDESEQGQVTLMVKRYEGGPMSSHIHDLKPDDKLEFKGPLPKYPWEANKHEHIALLAGGTGITPMYQLVRAVFNNPEDKTKVTLLFANVSPEDVLLKKEFDDLANKYPRQFEVVYVVDKADKNWSGETGYITKELLKKHLPEPKSANAKVFVCGPPPMYKALSGGKKSPSDQGELTGYLKELGYDKDQVFKF